MRHKIRLMSLGAVLIVVFIFSFTGCKTTTVRTTAETATAEENAHKQKIEKYAGAMEKYKEMSADEFEALPRDERLQYCSFVIDQIVEGGRYDAIYGEGEPDQSTVESTLVSVDNKGQEILDNFTYALQITYLQMTTETDGSPRFNAINGQKCLSSVYYEVGENKPVSSHYTATKTYIKALDQPIPFNERGIANNTSDLLDGIDENGDNIQYKIVTLKNETDNTLYAKFIYHEFANYDGTHKSIWLLDSLHNTADSFSK